MPLALASAGALLLLIGAGPARATPKTDDGHQVTLCHATASDTNPYVEITVDVASVLGNQGHDGHDGPVWTEDHPKHEEWGDIIPAFDFGPGEQYGGQNVLDGAALLVAHCELPAATTTSSSVPAPTTTSSTVGSTTTSSTQAPTTTTSSTVEATTTSTTEAPTTTSSTVEVTTTSTTQAPTTTTTQGPTATTSSAVLGESGSSTSTSSSTTVAAGPTSTAAGPTTQPTAIDPAHGSTTVADGARVGLPLTGLEADLLVPVGAALLLASLGTLGLTRRTR